MQEFESISASSYDPSALATKLTAKAAEGWSVVAIVPTGGDVTAFLTRDKGRRCRVDEAGRDIRCERRQGRAKRRRHSCLPAKTEADDDRDRAEGRRQDRGAKTEPVSEPSGWAIAPESTTTSRPQSRPACSRRWQPPAAAAIDLQPRPPATTPATRSARRQRRRLQRRPPPRRRLPRATAAAPDPAPAPAVPAGWYADPAGRFELRYWDGSTWTEHVSRAGQQFTDPPVA